MQSSYNYNIDIRKIYLVFIEYAKIIKIYTIDTFCVFIYINKFYLDSINIIETYCVEYC